jgi:aldose sugar dehydrogenase
MRKPYSAAIILIKQLLSFSILLAFLSVQIIIAPMATPIYGQEKIGDFKVPAEEGNPKFKDTGLVSEVVVKGLVFPTTFAFLDKDKILVLEKDAGTVRMVNKGGIIAEPLLDVNVSSAKERGILGIAISKNESKYPYVFLYYTESETADRENVDKGNAPLGNRLYRYDLVNDRLVNPKLLLDLPATPGPSHNGGAIRVGPDGNVYLTVGDVKGERTHAQNARGPAEADGRSGILRVTQDGQPVGEGILGDEHPLNFYYAYGIRNSFGMDFDPLTGNLWDTEVGNKEGDEINLVEPGFNSGYSRVQGLAAANERFDTAELVDFNSSGRYSEPELTWNYRMTPTAIQFLNSDKLGKQYENDLFLAGFNDGSLYHFDLNNDRGSLILNGVLADRVANSSEEMQQIIFGQNFGAITDLEVGPDGYLYVLSLSSGREGGTIYKIMPSSDRINLQ